MTRNNEGFTLVELIVSIAASALVIGAAISFMLLGLRMEKAASDDATVQGDSRIIMRVLENIAAEGEIGEILVDEDENGVKAWNLYAHEDKTKSNPILSFYRDTGTINGKDGVVIIDGIKTSLLRYNNNVLGCDITTESDDNYSCSVYCRVGVGRVELSKIDIPEEEIKDTIDNLENYGIPEEEIQARREFLMNMVDQYGSTGIISDDTIFGGYEFATWYWAINLKTNSEIWINHPDKVPWCAIFVSWALNKTVNESIEGKITQNLDALVDNVMWYQFLRVPGSDLAVDKGKNNDKFAPNSQQRADYESKIASEAYAQLGTWYYPGQEIGEENNKIKFTPNPGDVVFFENDDTNDRADHLGVVLYTDDNAVYVIEGNNNDRVGVFAYIKNEQGNYTDGLSTVIGYGVIDWAGLRLTGQVTGE